MPISIAAKSNLRRHLQYPLVGLPVLNASGGSLYDGSVGYRWNQAYAFLEWKMNTLNPDEEARITGYAYGSTLISGNTTSGDVVTLTISGGPLVTPQVISYTAGPTDTALTIAVGLAALANQNATLISAGFFAVAPYGSGPFSWRPSSIPLSEMAITNRQPFSFAATSSGNTAAAITTDGTQLHPRAVLTDPESTVPTSYYGFLPILDALETASAGASDDLSTFKADVWTARMDEVIQREGLYNLWRGRLSRFLDVPLFEDTLEGRSSSGYSVGMARGVM